MNAVTRSAIALATFAGVVACSAAPETISSTSGELSSIGTPPPGTPPVGNAPPPVNPPPAPVWPPSDATYCAGYVGEGTCTLSSSAPTRWNDVGDATLAALGCIPAEGLAGTTAYPDGVGFSVCFDTADVRAELPLLTITCDPCLPKLPSGELYVFAGSGARDHKPTCPSGCPSGGTNPIGRIGGSGTSSASK